MTGIIMYTSDAFITTYLEDRVRYNGKVNALYSRNLSVEQGIFSFICF